MLIGAMNHPMSDPAVEIEQIAKDGFDFVDLSLEPELAVPSLLDPAQIRRRLDETGLKAVGHTAYFLPITSPIPALRRSALDFLRECLEFFAAVGIKLVNIHPGGKTSLYNREWLVQQHIDVLGQVLETAGALGITMMLENMPPHYNQPNDLRPLFNALPQLGFHLDVGHANLDVPLNITGKLLAEFRHQVMHVHLSDNLGGREDLHLPLGAGKINWPWVARTLRRFGYDGTITLEVFSQDRNYLLFSKTKWAQIWEEAGQSRREDGPRWGDGRK